MATAALRSLLLVALFCLSACAGSGPFAASEAPPAVAPHALGPGERVRVIVFGEDTLTGEYALGGAGELAFPLIGTVDAAGRTPADLAATIAESLRSRGYLIDPHVTVEVIAYRPIYVLGEVNQPGEFPYQPGMTALAAIARAQGFTYRARQSDIFIKRADEAEEREVPLTSDLAVGPGDILRIGERYF